MKYLYIILAVLLLVCLAPMPYGYYQLVRFVAMVMFAVFAYNNWQNGQQLLAIVFGALALLFQPFIKVALGRVMWNVTDVVIARGLIGLYLYEKKVLVIEDVVAAFFLLFTHLILRELLLHPLQLSLRLD